MFAHHRRRAVAGAAGGGSITTFATFDPTYTNINFTMSEGDLHLLKTITTWHQALATHRKDMSDGGVWYWEIEQLSQSGLNGVIHGMSGVDLNLSTGWHGFPGYTDGKGTGVRYAFASTVETWANGAPTIDNTILPIPHTNAPGDIWSFVCDLELDKIWCGMNGVMGSGQLALKPSEIASVNVDGKFAPAVGAYSKGSLRANFGASPFTHPEVIPEGAYEGWGEI